MLQIIAGRDAAIYSCETRSLRVNGQCTSIRLEATYWEVLDQIARSQGFTTPGLISRLHAEVLERHGELRNFTSLLRCACLQFLMREAGLAPDPAIAAE